MILYSNNEGTQNTLITPYDNYVNSVLWNINGSTQKRWLKAIKEKFVEKMTQRTVLYHKGEHGIDGWKRFEKLKNEN